MNELVEAEVRGMLPQRFHAAHLAEGLRVAGQALWRACARHPRAQWAELRMPVREAVQAWIASVEKWTGPPPDDDEPDARLLTDDEILDLVLRP